MPVEAMLSVSNKVLLGLAKLEESEHEPPYTMEDITIAAWGLFPQSLGMKGYSGHPDLNKVVCLMSGKHRGLVWSGHVAKACARQYVLTPKGRTLAYDCAEIVGLTLNRKGPVLRVNGATMATELFLLHTFDAQVYDKAITGLGTEISFADACGFWGLINEDGEKQDGALLRFVQALDQANLEVGVARELVLSNGRVVTADNIHQLIQINEGLIKRYERHLKIIALNPSKSTKLADR